MDSNTHGSATPLAKVEANKSDDEVVFVSETTVKPKAKRKISLPWVRSPKRKTMDESRVKKTARMTPSNRDAEREARRARMEAIRKAHEEALAKGNVDDKSD